MTKAGVQIGFADAFMAPRLGQNRQLEAIAAAVKWYRFEKVLKKLRPDPVSVGRPPHDALMMFKALLLAQLYDLSDRELETALNDRISFRRFLGLPLESGAPDHSKFCDFRNRLVAAGLSERLFAEFNRQIEEGGFLLKQGTMIDATVVQAAGAPPRNGDFAAASDPDARFAKVTGKAGSTYGYKAHLGVDQGTRLIRSAELTPANVNETVVADTLICGDERAVYADKAYAKRQRRQSLRAAGIKPRIMHKSWGGGPPLTHWQKVHNRLISAIRAGVETVMADVKCRLGYYGVRYFGLVKNRAHLFLLATAYNMRRIAKLAA